MTTRAEVELVVARGWSLSTFTLTARGDDRNGVDDCCCCCCELPPLAKDFFCAQARVLFGCRDDHLRLRSKGTGLLLARKLPHLAFRYPFTC